MREIDVEWRKITIDWTWKGCCVARLPAANSSDSQRRRSSVLTSVHHFKMKLGSTTLRSHVGSCAIHPVTNARRCHACNVETCLTFVTVFSAAPTSLQRDCRQYWRFDTNSTGDKNGDVCGAPYSVHSYLLSGRSSSRIAPRTNSYSAAQEYEKHSALAGTV